MIKCQNIYKQIKFYMYAVISNVFMLLYVIILFLLLPSFCYYLITLRYYPLSDITSFYYYPFLNQSSH